MTTPFSVLTHLKWERVMLQSRLPMKGLGYPVAVYMFKTTVDSASISLSPIGVSAAWTAGPITKPRVWKSEKSAVWCVRSVTVVTFEMYARAEALIAMED